MSRSHLIKIAKLEIDAWSQGKRELPHGLVLAILFAFVHRLTTGETVEETFFTPKEPAEDFQI